MTRSRSAYANGVWVVILLCVCGVIAGFIAVSYWATRSPVTDSESPTTSDDTPPPWDELAASAELELLQEQFAQAVAERNPDLRPIIQAIRELTDRYPEYPGARTLLGQALLRHGDALGGYDQFERSLQLDGQQPEVHLLAGTIMFGQGKYDRAAHHYSMAVGLEPTEKRYHLHLAEAEIRLDQFDKARRGLLEVIRMDSSAHEAYASLSDLYVRQNKLTLAISMIQKAIDHTPVVQRDKQIVYMLRKARVLRRDNKPDEAMLTIQSLTPTERVQLPVLDETALCWAMLGKPREAAVLFEQAMLLDPTQWVFPERAALWRIKISDHETARRHLETLRKINPRAASIHDLEKMLTPVAQPAATE